MECHGSIGPRRGCGVFVCCLALALPVLAAAQNAPRAHDGGFFMRLAIGAGPAATELEEGGERLKFSGTAGDVNIALGAIVGENLALHGTLAGWSISKPELEVTGLGSGTIDGDLTMAMFGVGLTYYFAPSNVYLSGSIGLASLTYEVDRVSFDTDNGMALELALGKEWWVGNRWGLGLAAAVNYHSIPDGDVDLNWKGTSFALRFSATFN
jgi:hypothetical protein